MDFRTAMYEFCSYIMLKSLSSLDSSLTKSSFSAPFIKSSASLQKLAAASTLQNISQCFVWETLIESAVILFVHLESEFAKDKEKYLKNKPIDKIAQTLDFLLSNDFQLTKFSQQLKSVHKARLEGVKKYIGSIFNEKAINIVSISESTASNTTIHINNDSTEQDISPTETLLIKKLLEQNKMLLDSYFSQQTAINNNQSILNSNASNQPNVNFNLNNNNLEPEHAKAKFKNLITKLLTKLNQISINETHLENGTTPPSLFYNRLPIPMLHGNPDYVNDYNDLCARFQSDSLNLINVHLSKETESLENDLSSLKDNNSEILNNELTNEIKSQVSNSLKDEFTDKEIKAKSKTAQKWTVKTENQNNSYYRKNNWSYNSNQSYNSSNKSHSTPKRSRPNYNANYNNQNRNQYNRNKNNNNNNNYQTNENENNNYNQSNEQSSSQNENSYYNNNN